jgi:hypothetical protein
MELSPTLACPGFYRKKRESATVITETHSQGII